MRLGNLEAAQRADQLLDEGDMAGAEAWHRILKTLSSGCRLKRRRRGGGDLGRRALITS
jgi:hypothetical protein